MMLSEPTPVQSLEFPTERCKTCECREMPGHTDSDCVCPACNPWGQPTGISQGSKPPHWCAPMKPAREWCR